MVTWVTARWTSGCSSEVILHAALGGDMSAAAPELRQRILHGAVANENVRLAQLTLREAGFDPGEIDGVYGPYTARAVREFQVAKGLTSNGIVDSRTWRALAGEPAGEKLNKTKFTGIQCGSGRKRSSWLDEFGCWWL
jgi:peptidoglycan hydrolase-like protein with peptidoglycan-binding domain